MPHTFDSTTDSSFSGNQSPTEFDAQTVDLMSISPELRSDLTVVRHFYRGCPCFVIDDPASGRNHRLGESEYSFATALNGKRTVEQAVAVVAQRFGPEALSDDEALGLLGWLVDTGLLHSRARKGQHGESESQNKLDLNRRSLTVETLFQRFRFGNPDRYIAAITQRLSQPILVLLAIASALCLFTGATLFAGHLDALERTVRQAVVSDRLLSLMFTFAGLKVLHEFGHALACRLFGCAVRGCGIVMILFVPMPYVDVSSVSLLTSKWKRIAVSLAGVFFELMIASLAMNVFASTNDPLLRLQCVDVMVAAAITSFAFNLNPLMRFDGYYAMADGLEIPNLATQGSRALRAILGRVLIGKAIGPNEIANPKGWIIGHGILSGVWRVFITVTLLIAASTMFSGWGLLLVFAVAFGWAQKHLSLLLSHLMDPTKGIAMHLSTKRVAAMVAGVVGLGIFALFVPIARSKQLPTSIQLADTQSIRCAESGFVAEVMVRVGDQVQKGDPLCQLTSPELESELAIVQSNLRLSASHLRRLHSRGDIAGFQAETANEQSLRRRLDSVRQQLDSLLIVAPQAGQIVEGNLDDLEGRFLRRGEAICTMGDNKSAHIVALLPADQSLHWATNSVHRARLWVEGQPSHPMDIALQLDSMQASDRVEFTELAASVGGPLPVYAGDESGGPRWVSPQLKLTATLALDSGDSAKPQLAPGQVAVCRIQMPKQPIAMTLRDWWFYEASN
jgi:putative peptide zinc metalloprotease protein